MKNKIIAIALCLSLIFSISLFSREKAYADPFTASQIASTAYAMMESWGIGFSAGNATASGMNDFMTNQVEDYVNSHGGSIADVFVGQIAVDVAGKLVVAHDMYNSVVGFLDWLKAKYTLSAQDFALTDGLYDGEFLPKPVTKGGEITGVGVEVKGDSWNPNYEFYYALGVWVNGEGFPGFSSYGSNYGFNENYYVAYENPRVVLYVEQVGAHGAPYRWLSKNIATVSGGLSNSLSWFVSEDWTMPTVLNPDKEWTGTIGGYSAPDTNLDQLLGDIDQAVADNNLVVDGEVIDIPIPPPTPVPIDPGTPLGNVPWEGLDTNLQNLYNQGLEEIGKIGDAQDAITDAVADQTGAIEGAIAGNAGIVSGAINQAVSDIQDAISEQTQTLSESASATAEATESIAEALEDEAINWQKYDLRGLFPFCIPFDIYNMLKALDASPAAPHVQLPFVIESIGFNYTIDLDFSAFDQVAAVMRTMELIVYGIALAWATSKVIKW